MQNQRRERGLGIPETTPGYAQRYSREPEFALADIDTIPRHVSLRSGMTPVKDQGVAATCAAFGTTAVLEYKHKKSLAECNLLRECTNQTTGGLMEFLLQRGIVEHKWWPYSPDDAPNCRARAERTTPRLSFLETYRVYERRSLDIVAALSTTSIDMMAAGEAMKMIRAFVGKTRVPVCAEIPVFRASDSEQWKGWGWEYEDANVRIPRGADVVAAVNWAIQKNRWHLITICGYSEDTQKFEFKNSWGTSFGERGYGTITYDYINRTCRYAMTGK